MLQRCNTILHPLPYRIRPLPMRIGAQTAEAGQRRRGRRCRRGRRHQYQSHRRAPPAPPGSGRTRRARKLGENAPRRQPAPPPPGQAQIGILPAQPLDPARASRTSETRTRTRQPTARPAPHACARGRAHGRPISIRERQGGGAAAGGVPRRRCQRARECAYRGRRRGAPVGGAAALSDKEESAPAQERLLHIGPRVEAEQGPAPDV